MYTAARAISAILLAGLGFYVSEQIKLVMPPETYFGSFSLINAGLGAACGWVVLGPRVGYGYTSAISNGLTGMAALVFWGLFLQSFNEMLRLAMKLRFDGPFEAVLAIFTLGMEYGAQLLHQHIVLTLIFGSAVIGIIAEWVDHRWS